MVVEGLSSPEHQPLVEVMKGKGDTSPKAVHEPLEARMGPMTPMQVDCFDEAKQRRGVVAGR